MGRRKQIKATLQYPQHAFNPEDLLHFIELDGFSDDWKDLGLDDEALTALQLAIMAEGKNAPVISGTGGVRKLRFAPDSWHTGKSGAARICFAYFEEYGIVLLVAAYSKNEHDAISAAGKKLFSKLVKEAQSELARVKGLG